MDPTVRSLDVTFELCWQRLSSRLDGMGDREFLWEPVPHSWSVRPDESGQWVMDGSREQVDPEPVTTIAWRTAHLGGLVFAGFAHWVRDGGSPYGVSFDAPSTAEGARSFLATNYAWWREGMTVFPASRLYDPLGEVFGPFSESNAIDLFLHVLDEFIHHAAEIALLRDLYGRLGSETA